MPQRGATVDVSRRLAAWACGPTIFERHIRERDMAAELSDLEFGRRWAAMMGWRSAVWQKGAAYGHRWVKLPRPIASVLLARWYETEAAAYAALGRAVREVHRLVPRLES